MPFPPAPLMVGLLVEMPIELEEMPVWGQWMEQSEGKLGTPLLNEHIQAPQHSKNHILVGGANT